MTVAPVDRWGRADGDFACRCNEGSVLVLFFRSDALDHEVGRNSV